jgi:hypothetical protein
MSLTVCIEAGRQTLTHTSWTGVRFGSRKWMSGQAAALAPRNDRRLLAYFNPYLRFEARLFQVKGDLRLLLTFTYHRSSPVYRVYRVSDKIGVGQT